MPSTSPDNKLDFGYSWLWSHGHALVAGALAVVTLVVPWLGFSFRAAAVPAILAVWALAGYALMRGVFQAHLPMALPSGRFLADGAGEVVDLGCGSGRTSIMVAQARPGVRITGLDNFSARYIREHGEERLFRNLRIAGVDERVTLQRGDMLAQPFDAGTFDGAVSSYALDHLGKQIPRALTETRRVLKPGGQLLLMVILPDLAMNIAYPGLVGLAFPTRRRWRAMLREAGLQVVEEHAAPGRGWFLATSPEVPPAA
jgi:SAM-dependent methyltransferase